MAKFYTSVRVVNDKGEPVKAQIMCGGTKKGSTDEKTGMLGFDMETNGRYSISAKSSISGLARAEIKGGDSITLRLER